MLLWNIRASNIWVFSRIYLKNTYPASGRSEVHTCAAVSYMDFHGGLQTRGGQKVTGWKNSLDIISNFFETRSRYARLARSLTHVRRGVTVKHLAPAGAGYVTWIFVSNKICRFASAIWRTSLCFTLRYYRLREMISINSLIKLKINVIGY